MEKQKEIINLEEYFDSLLPPEARHMKKLSRALGKGDANEFRNAWQEFNSINEGIGEPRTYRTPSRLGKKGKIHQIKKKIKNPLISSN